MRVSADLPAGMLLALLSLAMDGCDILRDELTLTLSGLWDDLPSRGWLGRLIGILSGVLF